MGIYDREEIVERANKRVKIGSAVLIASGAVPIFLPLFAGLSVSLTLVLALLAAGIAHGILAFSIRERGASLWFFLVSATFLIVAMVLLAKQDIPIATLASAIAVSFSIEAVAEITCFAITQPRSGSRWALVNTIPASLLAFLIFSTSLRGSTRVLETAVGIALIVSGLTWILRSRAYCSYDLR